MRQARELTRKLHRPTTRQGYSLTELAIVLGVMAIVLAGIWGVVGYAQEMVKRDLMMEQLTLAVQNTRQYFGGQVRVQAGASTITDRLLRAAAIPPEMIRDRAAGALVADHPWGAAAPNGALIAGGGFAIDDNGNGTQELGITIQGLNQNACAWIAKHLVDGAGPPGLRSVQVNGVAQAPPLGVPAALAACGAAGAGATIRLVYRLRQQT